MKSLSRIRLVRAAALAALATAVAATARAAEEPIAPIPPPRPGLVESPKGNGKQLTPMRRTTHEERFNAALRLARRKQALRALRAEPPLSK